VIGMLDALRVERAVFVGLSMGGYVALSLWRQHRSRVRALALADTKAGADDQAMRAKRDELIDVARSKGSEAVAGIQVAKLVGKSTRDKHPDTYDAAHNMMAAAPADGVIAALRAMKERPDSTPILSTIDVPTLVLVGDEDVVTPVAEARAMHASIAGSRLEVLAGVGHLSSLERPAAFNTVLAEFLGSLELS
jgi:3-oxoadipate enol-lactonase